MPSRQHIFGDDDSDDDKVARYGDADNDDNNKPTDKDSDFDNGSNSYYDSDDNVLAFGRSPGASTRQMIARLVVGYHAAAAREDGARACLLLYSTLAKAVPEDQGGPVGPPYLRGGDCAAVMSKLFKHDHLQLAAYAARLKVAAVRVRGDRGFAVLSFKGLPGRQIAVEREHGVWKIDTLLNGELP